MSGGSGVPTIGQPQKAAVFVENGDGSKSAMEIMCVGLFTDGGMQTIANIVSQCVAAELNARGIMPLKDTAKS